MQSSPEHLIQAAGLETPPIGFYDAPDPAPFEPLVRSGPQTRTCVFAHYRHWLEGKTLHITRDTSGCGGAAHWLCGVQTRSREAFIQFLADEEGLKASRELMGWWLDHQRPYEQTHAHLLIGPLREAQYAYLKSVTFLVNPDQLALLALGAQVNRSPDDAPPVIAPFGSGCMQLVTLFDDLNIPQAVIGATDIAMRRYLPPAVLAFTVTRPLFEELCALDEGSFLHKPFWRRLREARKRQ